MAKSFSYVDMMRAMPAKILYNKKLEKHSEMLKPYLVDGYQEMEYLYPDFNWNYNWDWDFRFPRFDGNVSEMVEEAAREWGDWSEKVNCFRAFWRTDTLGRQYTPAGNPYDCDDVIIYNPLEDYLEYESVWVTGDAQLTRWNARRIWVSPDDTGKPDYIGWAKFGTVYAIVVDTRYKTKAECNTIFWSKCTDECECAAEDTMTIDEDYTGETIAPGGSLHVLVADGCGPFVWSVSGTGYSILKEVTDVGDRYNTVYSANGVCGVDYDPTGIVSVTDDCGTTLNWSFRNTGGSQWTLETDTTCIEWNHLPANCGCTCCSDCTVGKYKYEDCWCGGTNINTQCPPPSPCTKWGCTTDKGEGSGYKCSCAGFEFPFSCMYLITQKRWEWSC